MKQHTRDEHESTRKRQSTMRGEHRKELTRLERLITRNEKFSNDLEAEINRESSPFLHKMEDLREKITNYNKGGGAKWAGRENSFPPSGAGSTKCLDFQPPTIR